MRYFTCKVFVATFFICILSMLPISGYAQLGDPGEDPDAAIPIDGGVVLLIAAGVGYGVKKARDQRKKNATFFSNSKLK